MWEGSVGGDACCQACRPEPIRWKKRTDSFMLFPDLHICITVNTNTQTNTWPPPAPRFEINEKKNKNERNTLMVWQKVLRTVLVRYADISCIRLQQSRLPSSFQHRRASGYYFPPAELVFAIESKISSLNAVCSSFCLYSFLNVLWSRFTFDTMVHCVNPQNDRSEWPWYGKTSKCACMYSHGCCSNKECFPVSALVC